MSLLSLQPSLRSSGDDDSWFNRVWDNARLALHAGPFQSSSASGAPLHFQTVDLSARKSPAQTFSMGLHLVLVIVGLLLIAAPPKGMPSLLPLTSDGSVLSYIPPLDPKSSGVPSLGGRGSGGEQGTLPARVGLLAPSSSMPLVPPRLIHAQDPSLPAPPAVFDPSAPGEVSTVTHLGLPWMSSETDSAGPGKGHGFGNGNGNAMGDGRGDGAGDGDGSSAYANVASPVVCNFCPEPQYTEEARKAKLQGKILLQVFVGTDGAPKRIRILQGLGMGLDEKSVETVRAWRFSPARDAHHQPIAAWVTIETRFQLF